MIVKNATIYDPLLGIYTFSDLVINKGIISDNNLSCISTQNDCDIYDLTGKYVYPSFIDSHCHLVSTGKSVSRLNLENINSRSELIEILKMQTSEITILRGWDENKLGFIPLRQFLDRTNPHNSILLIRRCGHIGSVNSKCIQELDLESLDEIDGTDIKTGLLLERGLINATRKIDFNPQTEKKFFQLGASLFLKNGITSVHSEDWNINTLEKMAIFLIKQTKIRLFESICITNKQDLFSWLELRNSIKSTSFFDTSFIKLYLDGSLGGETAYLQKPYLHTQKRGVIYYSVKELVDLIQIAEKEQISIKIHIIGDGALEIALNAFSKAIRPGNPLRHKLIHVQLATKEQLQRILDLNLYVSIQPIFQTSDKMIATLKLGQKRYKEIGYPFRAMHELGINLSFSSDSPIETCNPFQTFVSSDQWLDRKDAFKYYTIKAADSLFQEKYLGSLKTGRYADAFVCDKDIFSISSTEINTIKPEAVIFHGKWLMNNFVKKKERNV